MPEAPHIPTQAELWQRWREVSEQMLAELPRRRRPGAMAYVKWLLRVILVAPVLLPPVVVRSFLDWVTDREDPNQEWREWVNLFRLRPLRRVP